MAMQAWLVWLLLHLFTRAARADHGPYYHSIDYDNGLFGDWPTETYRSSPLLGPAVNYIQQRALCGDDGLYTLIAPRGSSVRTPGPMIIDHDGHLVWTKGYGQTHGFGAYQFRGEDYLTFGVENDGIRGYGDGVYYMLDSSYKEAYTIKGTKGLAVDLREFHITRDETAVISAFEISPADLRPIGGPKDGRLYDCIVQEIDIETGKLLFQWRASEHVDFMAPSWAVNVTATVTANGVEAWDFFHLNSIDKDGKGNFLVSSGTANCLSYIDGVTGSIIWNLGGKNNSFEDTSDGSRATQFSGQHHARFHDNDTTITLFDNNAAGAQEGSESTHRSRGLYLNLNQDQDQGQRTVQIAHEYTTNIHSPSGGGSVQILDSGNVLQGYGLDPAWTEFTMDGDVLCHVHFGAASTFSQSRISSERVLKHRWTGLPTTSPNIALYGYEAAVSWNGATEIATWVLQGTNDPEQDKKEKQAHGDSNKNNKGHDNEFKFLTATPKTGFETILPIPPSTTPTTTSHLRILALDIHGHILGATELTPWDPTASQPILGYGGPASPGIDMRPFLFFVIGFLVAAGLAVVIWVGRRRVAARRVYAKLRRRNRDGDHDSDSDDYGNGYGGWDDEDGDLSDDELIDAVEFSLFGGRALGNSGLDDGDDG